MLSRWSSNVHYPGRVRQNLKEEIRKRYEFTTFVSEYTIEIEDCSPPQNIWVAHTGGKLWPQACRKVLHWLLTQKFDWLMSRSKTRNRGFCIKSHHDSIECTGTLLLSIRRRKVEFGRWVRSVLQGGSLRDFVWRRKSLNTIVSKEICDSNLRFLLYSLTFPLTLTLRFSV